LSFILVVSLLRAVSVLLVLLIGCAPKQTGWNVEVIPVMDTENYIDYQVAGD